MTNPSCAYPYFAGKKKRTRQERFLAEMEQVVPWAALLTELAGNRDVQRLYVLYPPAESCDLAIKLTDFSQISQQSLD